MQIGNRMNFWFSGFFLGSGLSAWFDSYIFDISSQTSSLVFLSYLHVCQCISSLYLHHMVFLKLFICSLRMNEIVPNVRQLRPQVRLNR